MSAEGMMLVELGGGTRPRGTDAIGRWINVDVRPLSTVDIVCDFERQPLPFADDEVDQVYAAHCLEHIWPYKPLLHEIARVCRIGARVEIRVPHWNQQMALCNDHKHTIGDDQVRHWSTDYIEDWFGGCEKRLWHAETRKQRSGLYDEAARLFPHLSQEQLFTFIPDTCHEVWYYFTVVPQE